MNMRKRAREIAMEVSQQRAAGMSITDSEILQAHPDLAFELQGELRKLRMLDMAKIEAEPEPSEEDDIRMTRVLGQANVDADEETQLFPASGDADEPPGKPPVPVGAARRFRPSRRPPIAMLRVYHDNQVEYENRILRKDQTVIGRADADILIEHDSWISSEHASISRQQSKDRWKWYLKDLDSTNGTFVRVDGVKLKDGDELIMGSERYRFSLLGSDARLEHIIGTKTLDGMGVSPDGTWVGRENSEAMEVFGDELMDEKHAFMQRDREGRWRLKDLGSTNGCWYRISQVRLTSSCVFQLGEQRIGFHL